MRKYSVVIGSGAVLLALITLDLFGIHNVWTYAVNLALTVYLLFYNRRNIFTKRGFIALAVIFISALSYAPLYYFIGHWAYLVAIPVTATIGYFGQEIADKIASRA